MISKLKAIIQSQSFSPGLIGIIFNPFYIARKNLHRAISEYAVGLNGDLLDVGCGTKPYESLFLVNKYVGLDVNSEHSKNLGIADYLYDGKKFPFMEATFDIVLCNQVFEHVFNPNEFLSEIARVLKKRGTLLLTVPFVWDEHEQPFDYARYTTFALENLLSSHGMRIIKHKKLGADISVIFQLINAYLVKVTSNWPKYLRFLMTITVMSSFNLLGITFSRILPKNQDLFLDHAILAIKE
jgi:SAM-dependent methyltransferase